MKNLIVLLVCSFFGVFLASACGGDSASSADNRAGAPDPDDADSPDPEAVENSIPGPGDDGPLGGGSYPIGEVAFLVTNPDGSIIEYAVSCLGDTATVFGDVDIANDTIGSLTGDRMCLSLADAAVRGRLVDGAPADQVCTQVFGSGHTAEVTGVLDGTGFSTTFHRADGCGINDWDGLMSDLLPPV